MSDFNLYLCLGSYWIQVEIRGSIRYSIRYRIRSPELTKKSRSIDRAETENQDWTQRSLDTKLSWTQPVPNHLLKKDQFVDDLFSLNHLPDQPVRSESRNLSKSCVFVAYEPTRIFQSMFHVREQVTKFLLISYRKSDWKTRLIRNHNWPGSGSGRRYYQ